MPKVSSLYLESRRQEILEAALVRFSRNGFHETTIQDIAREARLSHGAIYRYFGDKDDIIVAASARDRVARDKRFRAAAEGGSSLDILDRLFTFYIERLASTDDAPQRQLRVQVFAEGVRNPRVNASIRDTWEDVLGRIGAIVRRGQAAGEIDRGLDPDAVALVLASIQDGLVTHGAIDPDVDVPGCLAVFQALLHGGLAKSAGHPEEDGLGDGRALRSATG